MATSTTLDTRELAERVRTMYQDVALHPEREYHFETGRDLAERLGYPPAELDAVPAPAIDSYAGVGYFLDLAGIRAGETVLDVGSGSGTDSFLAALHTGPKGQVIGVDMTDAQLEKARRLAGEGGFNQVEFRRGFVEKLPVDDDAVDVVISNGVINLCPDKAVVFREIARALRPGGRLALADIVTDTQLPHGIKCDAALWASCIGGAMQVDDYRATMEDAGLAVDEVRTNDRYRFLSDSAVNATTTWGVKSISLLARKG